ncbi:IS66 family transposase [bacterium CPR1]|nr:IS66 family transposase [bacterium CPR1]
MERGQCCSERVYQLHPDVISAAPGAARTSIGLNAVSLMGQIRVLTGASFDKIARFFTENLGLKVSKAGVLNILHNLGEHLKPSTDILTQQLRGSQAVNGDETGWWFMGESGWAWSFSDPRTCIYRIENNRGHRVVLDVLGPDFAGWLTSDFLATYDPLPYKKSKCMAHLLRFLKEIIAGTDKEAACFARRVKCFVKTAMAIKRREVCFGAQLEGFRSELEADLEVFCGCSLGGGLGKRLVKRLQKHRKHILTFLSDTSVDATNNRAERDIRPFVIFRKLCGGTRSKRGAEGLMRLMSIYTTCRKRGVDFLRFVAAARQHFGAGPKLLALPPP